MSDNLKSELAQFTGTHQWHKFSCLSKLLMSDGVQYLAEKAGAYWLMDVIGSYQMVCNKDEMLRDYQIWTLTVKDSKGVVKCLRDTNDVAITQEIPYTDFPMESIKLICENGVIMLPQER